MFALPCFYVAENGIPHQTHHICIEQLILEGHVLEIDKERGDPETPGLRHEIGIKVGQLLAKGLRGRQLSFQEPQKGESDADKGGIPEKLIQDNPFQHLGCRRSGDAAIKPGIPGVDARTREEGSLEDKPCRAFGVPPVQGIGRHRSSSKSVVVGR